ncbi:MAG: HAD-IA family hydrolase [Muribaculaceae bacterium]|nr:HAD-IA family hydrolase [Muribaculaceae bacterium]
MRSDCFRPLFEGVRWVWLDLDDTLIDFRANSRTALSLLYNQESLDRFYPTPEEWTEAYETHNHSLWDRYSRGEITQDFLRVDRFAHPLAARWSDGREALEDYARHLDPLYLDLLASQKRLIDGAMVLLDTLRASGLKTGILSNGFTAVQHRKLSVTGIGEKIDLTVLSDDIGINKPDIRLYRHAMEQADDTDPTHHLMIGDNPSTDIAGALRAGWRALLLDPSAPLPALSDSAPMSGVTPRLNLLFQAIKCLKQP